MRFSYSIKSKICKNSWILLIIEAFTIISATAQIGTRFSSEKKVITDKVTGTQLTFLTSNSAGDYRIYQAQLHWTADGKWIVFRSNRVPGETLAVKEKSGDIVQVSEGSYMGMLTVAQKSMKFYFMRMTLRQPGQTRRGPVQLVEVSLERLFADSEAGVLKNENEYQRVCGTIPAEMEAGGDLALDAGEEWVYFRVGKEEAAKHPQPGNKIESDFGSRNKGAELSGISSMNIKTKEIRFVAAVPFQIGHIHTNRWVPGEIVFFRETEGKSPQSTWSVKSDGTGLRLVCKEFEEEWLANKSLKIKTGDNLGGSIYLIDRHTREMILLSAGHKTIAAGHPHPLFSPDGTKIVIQSAMFSENCCAMDICLIPVPEDWQKR